MSRILLMKSELANLIAAGEVIERPASVIKELVENSIDAQAKNIYIGVLKAGKSKIVVKDDGFGMDREDAKNCFLRHASSKIKTEYDLNRIHTLGFRGEAIPSIAAVSKVILTTSTGNDEPTRVESNPNEELIITSTADRKGTIFEVSDLFFNTPARLKYLKSEQVENYNIIEMVEHLALGFPNIAFRLNIDNKDVLKTSGRGDLLETIQQIYSTTIAKSLYEIKYEGDAFSFSGYISKPEINYSRRKDMLTFLNNRCIYDYKINKAIEDAYKDYLPPLRYPLTIINLNIDSSLVDVNVHPTKKEVRISLEDDIARILKEEIIKTLSYKKPIYDANADPKMDKYINNDDAIFLDDLKEEETNKIEEQNDNKNIFEIKDEYLYFQDNLNFEPTYENTSIIKESIPSENKPQSAFSSVDYYNQAFFSTSLSFKLPEMHPIGQVLQTYILCDSKDGFYIIDQHAAAERVNYEKTQALFAKVKSRVIPLFAITIELTNKEENNFDEEHKKKLEEIGIIAEEFGPKTIKVTEIPAFLNGRDDEEIIKDCIHACLNDEKADPLEFLHLTIATIACKKSIKANHQMSLLEIEGLLKDLAKCQNPANCPHGRPTMIKLTKDDIERIFRRSGF